MKRMRMEEITDLDELDESDCLLIIFKENNDKYLTFEFIKEEYFVNIFDNMLYVFDKDFEMRMRVPTDLVEKMVKVRNE